MIIKKAIYNNENAAKVDKDNVFINPNTSDSDLIIQNVGASDAGDYICEIKAASQGCTESQIVKLHVLKGKNNFKW